MMLNFIDLGFRAAPAVFVGILLAGLAPAGARAQPCLGEAITGAGSLGAPEKQQIGRCIDQNKAGLSSGDPDAIARSRRALLLPLRAREVSTAFRIEYAAQLLPVVRPLVADAGNEAAVNATRVLGELGTSEAVAAIGDAVKDKRPAVRLVGATAYQRALALNSAGETPILLVRQVQAAVRDMGAALQAEPDPMVADALVMSFEPAVHADPAKLAGVRADAIRELSGSISVKARDPRAVLFLAAIGRAADMMFDVVKDVNAVPVEIVPDAAGVAGDVLALAVRNGPTGLTPEQLRQFQQVLVRAEKTYLFSRQKADGTRPPDLNLAESFAAGDDRFRRDAQGALDAITGGGAIKLKKDRFPTAR